MTAQAIWGLALADFLERSRRYSFLATLMFAVFLGYETATGRIILQLDEYRGVYTSGWIGTLMAMVITSFVSLTGFYIVKNSVERDRSTGVGAILATTPISKFTYGIGKLLSNFAVLAAIVVILAAAALVMQFIAAEDPHIDLWALLAPFFLLALPAMAVTAALALCFEMVPGLRGGLGNVIWFFLWTFLLALPLIRGLTWLDPIGLATVMHSLSAEAMKHVPDYHGGMAFQIQVGQQVHIAEGLRWNGVSWDALKIVVRLGWYGASVALVAGVSQIFDRFDSAKVVATEKVKSESQEESATREVTSSSRTTVAAANLTAATKASNVLAFLRMFVVEIRLAITGYRWWWHAVAAGLLVAQFAAPLDVARGPLLACAWIWPTFLWSGLGTREKDRDTQQVIFSCPGILYRQFPASWFAGILISLLCGLGAGIRLASSGDFPGWMGWLAGAVFVPSLALALGVWSGTSKFFEGLYTALWYVGPMNHTPGLDYTGSASGAHTLYNAGVYFVLSATLFVLAGIRRKMQVKGS